MERTDSECGLCFQVFLLSWFVPYVLMPEAVTLLLFVKLLQLPSHSTGKVITQKLPLSVSVSLGMKQVDMISHQFRIEVRNRVHGCKVPDLKPRLLKDTSTRTNYMYNSFVNIWSPENLGKTNTHDKNVLKERCNNQLRQNWR